MDTFERGEKYDRKKSANAKLFSLEISLGLNFDGMTKIFHNVLGKAKVLYPYLSNRDDELTIQEVFLLFLAFFALF